MSELAVTLLRLSYLALLWVFVFAAISVLRQDLFSATRVTPRGRGARTAAARDRRAPVPAAPPWSPSPTTPPRTSGAAPQRQSITRPPSRLTVTAGKLAGTSLPLGGAAIVVGRAQSCTLVLEDDYASSRHARFFQQGDQWYVEDLGSTNGTTVAGRTISEPTPVNPGTEVRIGQTVLELRR
ncbi:MAG: FHA domain-containing protein [Actinomycetes bacterium]|nr:FHA domain-containing protein [Actinomycetes bacterium]MDX5379770.1 FHA domain-containing protein [Actinomycetes bacterium]MDX5398188.1 FHA domain-containing protein [Actinomycetes bacterium]MDX5449464.1 FHA domain-containing protein [Actinomycetes bacterium]